LLDQRCVLGQNVTCDTPEVPVITVEAKGMLARDVVIHIGGRAAGEFRRGLLGESGEVTLDGRRLRMCRQGGGCFVLRDNESGYIVARAQREGWLSTCWRIDTGGLVLRLNPRSWAGRAHDVIWGDDIVGTVEPSATMSCTAFGDLPAWIPEVGQVFVTLVARTLWDRAAADAAIAAMPH
jgi:hypothetical protein